MRDLPEAGDILWINSVQKRKGKWTRRRYQHLRADREPKAALGTESDLLRFLTLGLRSLLGLIQGKCALRLVRPLAPMRGHKRGCQGKLLAGNHPRGLGHDGFLKHWTATADYLCWRRLCRRLASSTKEEPLQQTRQGALGQPPHAGGHGGPGLISRGNPWLRGEELLRRRAWRDVGDTNMMPEIRRM